MFNVCVPTPALLTQSDACVLFQFRLDTGKCRAVVQARVDDFNALMRFVRDAVGEGDQPVVVPCNQNQIVAAVCQPVGVDCAHTRRRARNIGRSLM